MRENGASHARSRLLHLFVKVCTGTIVYKKQFNVFNENGRISCGGVQPRWGTYSQLQLYYITRAQPSTTFTPYYMTKISAFHHIRPILYHKSQPSTTLAPYYITRAQPYTTLALYSITRSQPSIIFAPYYITLSQVFYHRCPILNHKSSTFHHFCPQ